MSDLQFAKSYLTSLDNKTTKYQPDHVFDPKTFQTRIPYTLPKLPNPPHPSPPKSGPVTAPPPGAEPVPGPEKTVTITLSSSRNPKMTLVLSSQPFSTPIAALKTQIQSHLGGASVVGIDKIKILSNKKPIPSSKKTISDALDSVPPENDELSFGVFIMGGAPDPPPQQAAAAAAAEDPSTISTSAPESEKANLEAKSGASAAATEPTPEPMEGLEKATSPAAPVQPGEAAGKAVLESAEFWTDLQGFLEQRLKDTIEAGKVKDTFEKAWRSSVAAP